jgi:hypothetical protein
MRDPLYRSAGHPNAAAMSDESLKHFFKNRKPPAAVNDRVVTLSLAEMCGLSIADACIFSMCCRNRNMRNKQISRCPTQTIDFSETNLGQFSIIGDNSFITLRPFCYAMHTNGAISHAHKTNE